MVRAGTLFLGISAVVGVARADVVSDQPAAILVWPDVLASETSSGVVVDTIFQVTNTSLERVSLHCFHENANYHCSNTGQVCGFAEECCEVGGTCGICEPGWLETDFRIELTPRQPLGWTALQGLGREELPLTGALGSTGIGGSSNAGTNIPPVPEVPYNGVLKCIVTHDDGTPSDRNVVKGEATRLSALRSFDRYSVAKHNAVGFRAIEGAVNDDRELVLGGGDAEYEGCPEQLILNHLFDGVIDPVLLTQASNLRPTAVASGLLVGNGPRVFTRLTMVPCTQDLLRQIPGSAIAQYLVYNEFEQRFSTSRSVDCKFESLLSRIDTTDPVRSIFSAGVSGTVVGQTRIRAVGSGLIGVATEAHTFLQDDDATGSAEIGPDSIPLLSYIAITTLDQSDFNLHQQGDRAESDLITLP